MEPVENSLNISLDVYKQVMEEELTTLRTANQMLKIVNAQLRVNLLELQKETDQAYKRADEVFKKMSDMNKEVAQNVLQEKNKGCE